MTTCSNSIFEGSLSLRVFDLCSDVGGVSVVRLVGIVLFIFEVGRQIARLANVI